MISSFSSNFQSGKVIQQDWELHMETFYFKVSLACINSHPLPISTHFCKELHKMTQHMWIQVFRLVNGTGCLKCFKWKILAVVIF